MIDPKITAQIELAKTRIDEAEQALDSALAVIQGAARAEKVKVSRVVEEAFERLRAAREVLATYETSQSPDEQKPSP